MSDQLNAAIKRQLEHADAAHRINRRNWTREQWVADARHLFNDLDGSMLGLVNGHIAALLQEIDHLNTRGVS